MSGWLTPLIEALDETNLTSVGLAVVETVAAGDASVADLALLATRLADSGEKLPPRPDSVDVASSGGPGSLTTLITSSMLAANGYIVPKIAVPGRPAGGVDTLASVPGYDVRLNLDAAEAALARSRQVHLLATDRWAPMDGSLFRLRQQKGMQAVPGLVVASLLSKKLAAGVQRSVIDIRVGPDGNLGSTDEEAHRSGQLLSEVGEALGIFVLSRFSRSSTPEQPWIGRAEALAATSLVLRGEADPWTARHIEYCWSLAEDAAATTLSRDVSVVANWFNANLEAQGSSAAAFQGRAKHAIDARRTVVRAPGDGRLRIDLIRLRDEMLLSRRNVAESSFEDPVGVRLLVQEDELVAVGEPVAAVRSDPGTGYNPDRLASAFSVA